MKNIIEFDQNLYEKYHRIRSKVTKKAYKTCKNLFEKLKSMQRKIIIEIESTFLKMMYEIHRK